MSATIFNLPFLFKMPEVATSPPRVTSLKESAFAKLPDGKIVLAFEGTDSGMPAIFGIENLDEPDAYIPIEGDFENLGTVLDLEKKHPDLTHQIVEAMSNAGVGDVLSFVRMLDECLHGAQPTPAMARKYRNRTAPAHR